MKYSIIVPIYNVEQYLNKCVDSLRNQSCSDIEIILVDDESPDKSPEICDRYAKNDPRIKVIHKKNGGVSDARNAGLKLATGDYVMFVDPDDYIDTDTCEKLLPYTENDCQIIIGEATVEGGTASLDHIDDKTVMSGEEYLIKAYREDKAPMAVWLNVYNREFLKNNALEFKCGILHEDEEFMPRAFLCADSVVCTGVSFYHYILHENSITTQKDKRRNAKDLYGTLCALEQIYLELDNAELKEHLLNSLSDKYLSLFQTGRLYKYGSEYLHKDFVKRNAKKSRTKKKATLYCFSPRLYYAVNGGLKRLLKK